MTESEMQLEIIRLKKRLNICVALLLHTRLFTPSSVSKDAFRANHEGLLEQLNVMAEVGELAYLQDPMGLTDAERSLHADEFREAVEQIKLYVNSISSWGENSE